ncbi:hypothetical protein D0962_04300 [Leptolyngbyaceae cyanobacterium CCMR0082]|uniref:J domain-containing protein n=1 Tax=Adonisia turfae CCMR0082 TaxID=2304604 RepID=A0A6M0S246_9CYAN|nr:hypothetical protein [Adonisia turfae]NEZ62002.1 hypothetical protein [Adonisia turfae CCMR0082]
MTAALLTPTRVDRACKPPWQGTKGQCRRVKAKHLAAHGGELVAAWAVGKAAGGAIAQVAVAHGVPHEVAKIVGESSVQALAAVAIHAATHSSKPRQLVNVFTTQAAAAAAGKLAHGEVGGLTAGANPTVNSLSSLAAGKLSGLGTVQAMERQGRVLSGLIKRMRGRTDAATSERLTKGELQTLMELGLIGVLMAAKPRRRRDSRPCKGSWEGAMPEEFFGGMREISLAELDEYRVQMFAKADAKPRRRKCPKECECEPCQKTRKDALEALYRLDALPRRRQDKGKECGASHISANKTCRIGKGIGTLGEIDFTKAVSNMGPAEGFKPSDDMKRLSDFLSGSNSEAVGEWLGEVSPKGLQKKVDLADEAINTMKSYNINSLSDFDDKVAEISWQLGTDDLDKNITAPEVIELHSRLKDSGADIDDAKMLVEDYSKAGAKSWLKEAQEFNDTPEYLEKVQRTYDLGTDDDFRKKYKNLLKKNVYKLDGDAANEWLDTSSLEGMTNSKETAQKLLDPNVQKFFKTLYSPASDAIDADTLDMAMDWLWDSVHRKSYYAGRTDARGNNKRSFTRTDRAPGKPCGKSFISAKRKCSKEKSRQTAAAIKARGGIEKLKKRQRDETELKRQVKRAKGKKPRTITETEKAERRGQLSLFPEVETGSKPRPVRSQKNAAKRMGKGATFRVLEGGRQEKSLEELFADADRIGSKYQEVEGGPVDMASRRRGKQRANKIVDETIGKAVNKAMGVTDISLEDIEASDRMLQQSLQRVARATGQSPKQAEAQWNRIKLENQLNPDISIEEVGGELPSPKRRRNLTKEFDAKIKAIREIKDPDERARQARELTMEAERLESRWGRSSGLSSIRRKTAKLSREMFGRTKAPQPKRANKPMQVPKKEQPTLFETPDGRFFSIDSREWDKAVEALNRLDGKKKGTPCKAESGWVGMKKPEGRGCKRAKKGTAARVRGVQRKRMGNAKPVRAYTKEKDPLTRGIKERLWAHMNKDIESVQDISKKYAEGKPIAAEVRKNLKGKIDPGLWLNDNLFGIADIEDFGIKERDLTSTESVDKAYKKLARQFHPDKGGSGEQMANLNRLRSQMKSIAKLNSDPQPKKKKTKATRRKSKKTKTDSVIRSA